MLSALSVVAALVASASAQVYPDHNILINNMPMFVGRIDPIVNPGKVSPHCHTVIGASNFRCKLSPISSSDNSVH